MELISATDAGFASVIRERIAIGPSVATYEVYAPSHYGPPGHEVVVLRDGQTGRTLAQQLSPAQSGSTTRPSQVGPTGLLIGISGQTTLLEDVVQNGVAAAGFLPTRFLPRTAIGYDAIEVLFLNQPNMGEIAPDQQQAILDWVRAGGSLLLAPGDGPAPAGSRLMDALPCGIGNVRAIDLSDDVRARSGLTRRSGRLAGRELIPLAGSKAVEIFPGAGVVGFVRQMGLGKILVMPFSPVSVRFDPALQQKSVRKFWEPVLGSLVNLSPPEPKRKYDAPYYGYQSESEEQEREGAATSTLCDSLVAPMGTRFQLPLVVLGILLIVGPVDSIALYATGRRHWNWATGLGWLGFVVGIIVYAAMAVGPAHLTSSSVRLVDQAGDRVVATTELAGAGSAVRRRFTPEPGLDGWYQPAIPGTASPQSAPPQSDALFHENEVRSSPEPLWLEAGWPRFVRSDDLTAGPPVIEASLRLTSSDRNSARLVGSVKNLSTETLSELRLRSRFGVVALSGISLSAGQSIAIDVPASAEAFSPEQIAGRYQNYGTFGSRHVRQPVAASDEWLLACDLSGRRSLRVDDLIDRDGNFACVYARMEGSAGGSETVRQWLRAMIPLQH